ncbi:MAG: asparagine synthetase B, partial [Pirellulaceae bacterium]|nr:asparagine synthetase B [Pirellulaceae bacterium]
MCGIAGIHSYDRSSTVPLDADIGLQMVDALSHRGPDDGGLLVAPELLLGHRRLSILDLSDAGHQPMSDQNQNCWIVFNGEIYNFADLRVELESVGHKFRSGTDTEVILRGYLQWGRDVVHRLNGMFAFAIWDRRDSSLWLVRDAVGVKPLFIRDDGQQIWFGSEIKAILADSSVPRKPDWNGLNAFLTFGYTPAPATGFSGIEQIQPGHSLVVQDGHVTKKRWASLPYGDHTENWSAEE